MKRNNVELDEGSPNLIGPFMVPDPQGFGVVIPGPLTSGPPQPEPEERWTLAPGHASVPVKAPEPDADALSEPPGDPSGQ